MKTIVLDATTFIDSVEFLTALTRALGAPDWHGLSIDAFVDTMVWHPEVHRVNPPYVVHVENVGLAQDELRRAVTTLGDSIKRARAEHIARTGRDVPVTIAFNDKSFH